LLLASYISTEQFAHFSAKAEGEAAIKHKGADHQAVQVEEDERSGSDSDNDKQNVEESDSGSDSDSGDEDASKKEKKEQGTQETAQKAEAKPAAAPVQSLVESRDQFGRDPKGNYLDQNSYVKKRNELNQKEESHRSMYNSVAEKLEDTEYVVNAL
jgi:hypothetical protein